MVGTPVTSLHHGRHRRWSARGCPVVTGLWPLIPPGPVSVTAGAYRSAAWDRAGMVSRQRLRGLVLVVVAGVAPLVLLLLGRVVAPADGTATFPSAPPWGDGVVL